MSLPVHHIHALPFSWFPLYILISVISLALPEPFWKGEAGKKKQEEKKKENKGKNTRNMVQFKVNTQNN